jgi:hypothetical protein
MHGRLVLGSTILEQEGSDPVPERDRSTYCSAGGQADSPVAAIRIQGQLAVACPLGLADNDASQLGGALGLLFALILLFPIAAITGGVACALVGGGREDRPIWKNGIIGIVGWAVAWVVMAAVAGTSPEELTLGLGFLALLASIAFILVDEWWYRRSHPAANDQANFNSSGFTVLARDRTWVFLVAVILVLAIVLFLTVSLRA